VTANVTRRVADRGSNQEPELTGSGNDRFGSILLKNSVSTEDESNLALIGREGRVKLRGYKDEPISQPRASPLRHKRNVDGNFDRIRSWRKFSALAISSFSTE